MLSSRAPAAVAARLSVSARLLAAFRRALGAELACDYLRSCNTRGPATLRRNALGGRDAVSFVELLARDGIAVRKNQRSPLAFDVTHTSPRVRPLFNPSFSTLKVPEPSRDPSSLPLESISYAYDDHLSYDSTCVRARACV